jgi:hypothetical protein
LAPLAGLYPVLTKYDIHRATAEEFASPDTASRGVSDLADDTIEFTARAPWVVVRPSLMYATLS